MKKLLILVIVSMLLTSCSSPIEVKEKEFYQECLKAQKDERHSFYEEGLECLVDGSMAITTTRIDEEDEVTTVTTHYLLPCGKEIKSYEGELYASYDWCIGNS